MDVYTTTPDKPWLMLARFNGRPLNFNCSFILVLMLRKSLTWLRSTRLAAILPVDQHVTLHKLVGIVVVFEAFLHAVGHFGNCGILLDPPTFHSLLVNPHPPCSIFLGRFLSWCDYLIERTLRLSFIRRVRNGKTYIKEAVNLPASVTYLIITRPPNFDFRAGEYVFICIPSIASHEWHPFTVSSAPELKEYITVHIRAQGNWTKRIFNFVKKYNNEKVGIRKESQRLEALIEEGSPSGSNTNNLKCTSVVSVLRNENETSIHGTPATVRNIAVLSKDDDRFAVTNFSAKYDTKEDLTSNRSSELYGSSPNGWMKSEIVVDDRKALLSRASSKSGSSSNSNNDLTASSSAARSHGTLPELRGTPPMAMKRQKQGLKSGKRSNLKNDNRVKPMTIGDSSPRLSDSERLRTVSESMANNNNSASTQPEEPQQGADRNTDNQQSQSNKRLTNAVSMTMKTGRLLRHKRSAFVQRRTQHSLDLTNHVGWEVDDHTGIEIIIDGPYGAPSQHIYEAEHAVLIAGGIGVTPFASILQSIHQRYKEYKLFDPMCWSSSHIPNSDDKTFNLRKVDFVWINRHQKSFEWFISLLNLIEIEQEEIDPSERLINMHLYMTSALSRNDVKAIGLYVALDLIHQKQRRDMITGLMTRTQAGRPDWDKLFTTIGQENCGKVTVFFCGSPQLGHVVQQKCHEHGFGFRKENF
ncbi:putative NADPH oxidase 5 [Apostichopus japonicus]|uniref:Putative NADPH oxidase 5 n=1 Tax=Stichopus japonicus TaxID=307972 RepID=A0A2G8KIU5_STIJA|nr:putative NADPH oxidase 5 [Apostichopus japonicus]